MTREAGPKRSIPEDVQIRRGARVRTKGDLRSPPDRARGSGIARTRGGVSACAGSAKATAEIFRSALEQNETEVAANPDADRQHGIPVPASDSSDPKSPYNPPVSEAASR